MGKIRILNEWSDKEQAVKDRLRSFRVLVKNFQVCSELLDRLDPRTTSGVVSDQVVLSGGNRNEKRILKKIDLEEQMQASMDEMEREFNNIWDMIQCLPIEEFAVLYRRYIFNERMEQISQKLHFSVSHCWRVHKRAIELLAQKVDSSLIAHG